METTPRRGQIVRCGLDPVTGSEQAGERPVLVLSPDYINERSPVVLVAALTTRKTERVYPFEALIEPPDGGISVRSKVSLMQLRSVDKSRITYTYGMVSQGAMREVDAALEVAVGLVRL